MTVRSLRLTCPEDLIAAGPALLGFYPQNSVVMISAGEPSFQARVDLPAADDSDAIAEVVGLLAQPVERHNVQTVCLLAFTENRADALAMHQALAARFDEIGVRLPESLHVTATHYESFLVHECIPQAYDISDHPLLAEAVYDGREIKNDRASLTTEVERDADAVAKVKEARRGVTLSAPESEIAWATQAVRQAIGSGKPPTPRAAARLFLGLAINDLRDAHWVPHTQAQARTHAEAWTALLRRCPDDLLAPVASVVAMLRFRSGDGARAWTALDTTEATYTHSLGRLVGDMLSQGVSPGEVDAMYKEAQGA